MYLFQKRERAESPADGDLRPRFLKLHWKPQLNLRLIAATIWENDGSYSIAVTCSSRDKDDD